MTKKENQESAGGIGRPKKHPRKMSKIGITVSLKQIIWIDKMCISILENTENTLDRGTVIRAILAGAEIGNLDLSHCATEEEIVDYVAKKLQEK